MAPALTALDLLVVVLSVGLVGALFGWAGGKGAMRSASARMLAFENLLYAFDRRIKQREGAVGQAATQKRKTQLQERDEEADRLAQQLARSRRGTLPIFGTEQDKEEAAMAQLEKEAEALGLKAKGKSG